MNTPTEMKSLQEADNQSPMNNFDKAAIALSNNGIELQTLNDDFNTALLCSMEEYASQYRSEVEALQRENQRLREACETVVSGYEGDGMENMKTRDEVFYRVCKTALLSPHPETPNH